MPRSRPSSHRPRGWARHLAAVANPTAAVAGRVAMERDADLRLRRLRAAARDRAVQRVRPTRPTMRALSAAPGARIRWRSVPAPPDPGPLGAVVHPIAVASCDLDRAMLLGSAPFALPLCPGHECVAEVLRVGSQVTGVEPGRRVVVPFQISCGACGMCRNGFTANCAAVPPISMYGFGVSGGHWGGALSDELAVPFADGMLVPLPEGIDPAAAASVADNVSDGYRHLGPHLPRLLERDPDAEVRIVGARGRRVPYGASVSLYAGLVAQALGARRVRMVEARPHVRAQAEALGIETLAPSDERGLPTAPLVLDVSFEPAGLKAALEATAPDGVCTSSGALHRAAKVPIALMYGRNATLHVGRTHARAVIPDVLELMADGRLQPEKVTDCLADIDDAPRALRDHARGNATKTILVEA
jgi:alcohol dehydrogenase